MVNSNISQVSIVADFRKGAKALIQLHAVVFEAPMSKEQYNAVFQSQLPAFEAELKTVYEAAVKNSAYFAEGLRGIIKAELDKSFENYLSYYQKRFSEQPAQSQ